MILYISYRNRDGGKIIMIGNVLKIYATKDIFIGYVDTISFNNLTNESQIITKILPLQKIISKDKDLPNYKPLSKIYEFYSISEIEPIVNSMKDNEITQFISTKKIDDIIEKKAKKIGAKTLTKKVA